MQTVLLTLVVIGLTMGAMAVGVIFTRRPLKGSCGGTGEACACSRVQRMRCSALSRDADG
jgi:hypothetical protein